MHGIPVIQPERIRKDPAAFEVLERTGADIQVVVAYGQIIPSSIIDLPKHKSVNVHFSLLPKYRGACPVQWALLNGEKKTGVTIFRLNEKMDEGDILSFVSAEILPHENAGELEARLAKFGAVLLMETLARIETLPSTPQDHSSATYAPKIHKEEGKLDWAGEASAIDRKVRAFTPRPSAYTFFKGQRLIILEGRELEGTAPEDSPGKVVSITKEGLTVCCKNKTLYKVGRLQPESKKAMEAYTFSLNKRIRLMDILG
jgi:methionyl-tRNA formyltransferase